MGKVAAPLQYVKIAAGSLPFEIGESHARQVGDKIQRAFEFYSSFFRDKWKITESELQRLTKGFEDEIFKFNRDYYDEMRGISHASQLSMWKVVLLNSRSEILNLCRSRCPHPDKGADECTAIGLPTERVLGQNWDWDQAFQDLSIVLHLPARGVKNDQNAYPEIVTITEPGVLGKIGVNSWGLATTLNLLNPPSLDSSPSLPLHVILRDIMRTSSVPAASHIIKTSNANCGSAITLIDAHAQSAVVELNGHEIDIISPDKFVDGIPTHTNHYLGCGLGDRKTGSESSYMRLARAREISSSWRAEGRAAPREFVKSVLGDRTSSLPILRPFVLDDNLLNAGTVCSVVMDVGKSGNLEMEVATDGEMYNAYELSVDWRL